jgi:hypothetical protein
MPLSLSALDLVPTHAFDTAARIRSYELLAQTFGLTT